MMKKTVILKAEHHSSGSWADDGEISWEQLNLSQEIISELNKWTDLHASFARADNCR